jgi:hypothetical protein
MVRIMSAFICSNEHLSVLAAYAALNANDCLPYDKTECTAREIGRILHAENVRSVNYRYTELNQAQYKHVNAVLGKPKYFQAAQILKAANCLHYQSCEHSGWDDSLAKRILDNIIACAIHQVPGYADAEWHICFPHAA